MVQLSGHNTCHFLPNFGIRGKGSKLEIRNPQLVVAEEDGDGDMRDEE